jgi:hypothetical protein
MSTPSRKTTSGTDGNVITAIHTQLETVSVIPAAGKPYSPDEVAALVQRRIDLSNAIVTSRAAWLATIQQYDELSATVDLELRDLRNFIGAAFGDESPQAKAFPMLKFPKKVARTPEEKKAAAAKALATRKARKTMGRKQKLAIKGDVSGTTVTPTKSTPADAATAEPTPTR